MYMKELNLKSFTYTSFPTTPNPFSAGMDIEKYLVENEAYYPRVLFFFAV